MYLGLEVEKPGLRGSFLIGGLEGARVCGYCFGDFRYDGNFSKLVKITNLWPACHELIIPLKTYRVEVLMHVKSVGTQCPPNGGEVRKRDASSGVVHVTRPRFIVNHPCTAIQLKRLPVGVEIWRRGCQLRCRPPLLTMVRNYEVRCQTPSVAAVAEWYRYRTMACFVTGSSPVPLKTRRVGQRCTLNLSRAETSSRWCGVVVRRGGASSGVVHVTRGPSPKALV
ncbi:uncharacterized protein TNCV_2549681 [Trichonephila clavipes]|nr:uncharacterized protein TNCV_2549681 [Trichonephila clavipes]